MIQENWIRKNNIQISSKAIKIVTMRLLNIKNFQYYQSKLEIVGSNDLFLVSYDYYSNVWKSCKSKNKGNKKYLV